MKPNPQQVRAQRSNASPPPPHIPSCAPHHAPSCAPHPATTYPAPPAIPEPSPIGPDGYPVNWGTIAATLKAWAGYRCECCFHPDDYATGYVLTVHHLDGNKANCHWRNLLVCCQRCHLRIQAAYYPGQLFMFGRPIWSIIRC